MNKMFIPTHQNIVIILQACPNQSRLWTKPAFQYKYRLVPNRALADKVEAIILIKKKNQTL